MRTVLFVLLLVLAACGAAPTSTPDASADVFVAEVAADTSPTDAGTDATSELVDVAETAPDVAAPDASMSDAAADVADAADAPPVCSEAARETLCAGRCVDTELDVNNCGACGVVCTAAPSHAHPVCRTNCTWGCDIGYGNCDGVASNGCEEQLRPDGRCP